MTGWNYCILDGIISSLTRTADQPRDLFINLYEVLGERLPTAVATYPVNTQNQIVHFLGDHHSRGHFVIGQQQNEFHLNDQGYFRPVGSV